MRSQSIRSVWGAGAALMRGVLWWLTLLWESGDGLKISRTSGTLYGLFRLRSVCLSVSTRLSTAAACVRVRVDSNTMLSSPPEADSSNSVASPASISHASSCSPSAEQKTKTNLWITQDVCHNMLFSSQPWSGVNLAMTGNRNIFLFRSQELRKPQLTKQFLLMSWAIPPWFYISGSSCKSSLLSLNMEEYKRTLAGATRLD